MRGRPHQDGKVKVSEPLIIGSPIRGWCDSLDDNPDMAFRQRLLGDGVSIDPIDKKVVAPCDGVIVNFPESRHAITIRADNGAEILIHIGIDTVGMCGEGFSGYAWEGDRVSRGQLLLSFDLGKIARSASSLRTPVVLLSNEMFQVRDIVAAGLLDEGDEIYRVVATPTRKRTPVDRVVESADDAPQVERKIVVGLPHGIHARPAASVAAAIRTLHANVNLINSIGEQADARSPIAMMSLNIQHKQRIGIVASGKDAERALEKVASLLKPIGSAVATAGHAGYCGESPAGTGGSQPRPVPGAVLRAQSAAGGLAKGRSFLLRQWQPPSQVSAKSVAEELRALQGALDVAKRYFDGHVEARTGAAGEIASMHRILLDDVGLNADATLRIEQGRSAMEAWSAASEAAADLLRQADDVRMRERADDIVDVSRRVLRVLAGLKPAGVIELEEDTVLLAEVLLPSQLLEFDRGRVSGICTAAGGATSHVAIMAASMNIPMLTGAGSALLAIPDGTTLLVDAEAGELTVEPTDSTSVRFEEKVSTTNRFRLAAQARAHEECRTTDGIQILVKANIASLSDAKESVEAGADGCGLLRSELLFLDATEAPTEGEQLEAYQQIADVLGDRPLTIRTLDAGGDKPVAYVNHAAEENPALGMRGIRLSLHEDELLKTQLKALYGVETKRPLQIMLPMVATVEEIEAVAEIASVLDVDRRVHVKPEFGVMIETPSAALIADKLAEFVRFFSIGTNDLVQYALAMDRTLPSFSGRLDVLHPAVLKLISMAAAGAVYRDIPVSVCGGAAGDVLAVPLLIGLGIRELSMTPGLIPQQKARIREWKLLDCESLAREALTKGSAREVRELAQRFIHSATV